MATFQLTVILGASAGQTFDVPETGVTLGRSRLADIQLSDGGLSRLHCRFYLEAGRGMVQDLGSSNGTSINGAEIAQAPVRIENGDCIAVGETALRVSGIPAAPTAPAPAPVPAASAVSPVAPAPVAPAPASAPAAPSAAAESLLQVPNLFAEPPAADAPEKPLDLGLTPAAAEEKRRNPLAGLLFAVGAILVLLLGALAIFTLEKEPASDAKPRQLASEATQPFEFAYERLCITEQSLFRYTLTYTASGKLALSIDDLGAADRSFKKEKVLSAHAQQMLRKEVVSSNYPAIRDLFPERSPDGMSLRRKTLTLVLGTEIWRRVAENVDHQAFDALCERLELFGRNELGAWATQYSVSELEEMGREQLAVAQRYWEQRDMGDEKLFQAVTAYRKGVSALETLNPKPAFSQELTAGLREATALLDTRYEAAAFAVDQAFNTQRYDRAAEELRRILRLIPDRDDERNQKAMERLLLIENRYLRNGGRL